MKENLPTYRRIEAYLLNQMNPNDRLAFQEELKSNKILADQFKQQELEHKLMEAMIEKDLKADLQTWSEEDSHTEAPKPAIERRLPNNRFNLRILLSIAATLLLLIALFWWSQNDNSTSTVPTLAEQPVSDPNIIDENTTPNSNIENTESTDKTITEDQTNMPIPQKENNSEEEKQQPKKKTTPAPKPKPNYLALAEAYEAPINFSGTTIRDTESPQPYEQAITFFEKKDYDSGIAILLQQIASENAGYNDSLNLAWGYYASGAYKKAIPFLNYIIETESADIDEAQWRLALAYLKLGEVKKSTTTLQSISHDTYHPFHQKASSLLKEIQQKQ